MTNPVEFKENSNITIELESYISNGTKVTKILSLTVVKSTDKAVCFTPCFLSDLQYTSNTVWLPKSALESIDELSYKLKNWFQPNGYQQWFINEYVRRVSSYQFTREEIDEFLND